MNILVTGGAGYIGSITCKQLQHEGHNVIVYDHLERNDPKRVEGFDLIKGDTRDIELLVSTLKDKKIEAVVHFAAYIEAGESMQNPAKYFQNNVYGSMQLLQAMVESGVNKLVFSSTAAVYGNPVRIPIIETDLKIPVNTYGETKLMVEQMLKWFDQIHGLRSIAIRYFNAAGALLDGSLGEDHKPETHLIPNIFMALREDRKFKLFGNDYDTDDGTCVRDYIHVLDLAQAHIIALDALNNNHSSDVYNAGTGHGFSNREILETVEKVTGQKVEVEWADRRPGDSAVLIADSSKLKNEFGWQPQYSNLETIIDSAWKWFNR